jgi:hypothetical protein
MMTDATSTFMDTDNKSTIDPSNGKKGILDDFMQFNDEPFDLNGKVPMLADNPIAGDNNNINNMDLFGGNGLEFLNASELCGNLELLGFGGSINPLSIDNYAFDQNNKRQTPQFAGSSKNNIFEEDPKRKRKRKGGSVAAAKNNKPPSPRGRPRSIHKNGRPSPPNIYEALTSPTLVPSLETSPMLINATSPALTGSDHHTPSPPLSDHNPANVINNTSMCQRNILLDPMYWAGIRQNIWAAAPQNPFFYRPPPPHMMNYYWGQNNQQAAAAASALGIKPPKVPIMPSMDPRQSLEGDQAALLRAAPLVMKPPSDDSDSPTSLNSVEDGLPIVPRKLLGEMQAAKEQFLAETKTIDVETITVQEMKAILKKFGLITTGKKKELYGRIVHTRQCLLTTNTSRFPSNDNSQVTNNGLF